MTGRTVIVFVWLLLSAVSARADAAFDRWLQTVWPDAQALGISRATFDAAVRGLEPDFSLPDLAIPGKPEKQSQQPEFVQTPAQYLREAAFQAFTSRGRELAAQYRDTLARNCAASSLPREVNAWNAASRKYCAGVCTNSGCCDCFSGLPGMARSGSEKSGSR